MTQRKLKFFFFFPVFSMLLFLAPAALAADTGGIFEPGNLISDSTFGNYSAFSGSEGIQKFLEIRGSVLADTSPSFLKKLKEPADADLKIKIDDPSPNLGRLRTAAELIYDSAVLGKINPQVIMVTLQKEQSLIDGTFTDDKILQRRLDRAMGFACPDSGACGDLFLGFYFQLFGNLDDQNNRYLGATRSLSKSFYTESGGVKVGRGPAIDASSSTFGASPKVRTSKAGDTITVDNTQGQPYNAPATSKFTIKNAATASLYRYTPHVYNGNYNFWKFFRQWFKFANGSLLKLAGQDAVYYLDNGQRRTVSGTVMSQRKLDVISANILSQAEMDEYPLAKPLPPTEGTIVSAASGGAKYLVEQSQLREISDFVANARKLNFAGAVYLPDDEVKSYEVGQKALPPEGTLLKSASVPVVYIVQDQTLRPISGFVFGQRKFAFSSVKIAPSGEVADFPKGATLPPLDGTLAKTAQSPLVYYVALGQKFPVPGFVFKLRKFKFGDVVVLGADEIENLALAQHLAPLDGTLLKAKGNGTVYLVQAGALHYISGFMFKQQGFKFKNVVEVSAGELALLPQNSPVMLADGALIKVKGEQTVYVLQDGNKQPITYAAFTARKYKFSDVLEVPKEESDRYPQGTTLDQ